MTEEDTTDNPKVIYLQPHEESDVDIGRTWCQDKQFSEDTKYIRYDVYEGLLKENQELLDVIGAIEACCIIPYLAHEQGHIVSSILELIEDFEDNNKENHHD